MQRLGELFDVIGRTASPAGDRRTARQFALVGAGESSSRRLPLANSSQGRPAGPTARTGRKRRQSREPWDFVLMMEGSLLFSSRATRRLDPNEVSRASAPFAVRSHAAGFASPGTEKAQRGEQWMPLWSRPATLSDVAALFGEARIQLDRQTANRPVDVARAISRLGVARGIDSFTRYGYLERNGQSTLAVPLGPNPRSPAPAGALDRRSCALVGSAATSARDKNAPARLIQAERRLADAVFAALDTRFVRPTVGRRFCRPPWRSSRFRHPAPPSKPGRFRRFVPNGFRPWMTALPKFAWRLRWAARRQDIRAKAVRSTRSGTLASAGTGCAAIQGFGQASCQRSPRCDVRRDPLADCAADRRAATDRSGHEGPAAGCRWWPPRDAVRGWAILRRSLAGAVDVGKVLDLARAFMAIKWDQWSSSTAPAPGSFVGTARRSVVGAAFGLPALATRPRQEHSGGTRHRAAIARGRRRGATAIALARLRAAGIRPPLQAGVTDAARRGCGRRHSFFPLTAAVHGVLPPSLIQP